jgi:predicted RNA-binding protein with PUA-like domain
MAYWLLKSEPHTWSWDQQKKEGRKGSEWDGVRNFQARKNMQTMQRGDLAFFYHSGEEKSVVGIVKVVAEAHPDSTDRTGVWQCVDVAAVKDFARPVTLAEIKAEPSLKSMVLVRNSRLSVQPVASVEWKKVCAMGGVKDPRALSAEKAPLR